MNNYCYMCEERCSSQLCGNCSREYIINIRKNMCKYGTLAKETIKILNTEQIDPKIKCLVYLREKLREKGLLNEFITYYIEEILESYVDIIDEEMIYFILGKV